MVNVKFFFQHIHSSEAVNHSVGQLMVDFFRVSREGGLVPSIMKCLRAEHRKSMCHHSFLPQRRQLGSSAICLRAVRACVCLTRMYKKGKKRTDGTSWDGALLNSFAYFSHFFVLVHTTHSHLTSPVWPPIKLWLTGASCCLGFEPVLSSFYSTSLKQATICFRSCFKILSWDFIIGCLLCIHVHVLV